MKNVYEVLKDLGHEIPEELQQYYGNIEYWKQWWQGYVPKFHQYKVTNIEKELMTMKRKSLKMAKKYVRTGPISFLMIRQRLSSMRRWMSAQMGKTIAKIIK